ncbi:hypothetical protein FRB90_011798 [Tulasnella sp. 427]|nr:hypothetical protein FRB90_011798 [Tulasnella sp. 427]
MRLRFGDVTAGPIADFVQAIPQLESLHYSAGRKPGDVVSRLCPSLLGFSQLKVLNLSMSYLDSEVLQAASQIISLERCQLGWMMHADAYAGIGTVTFPTLKEMSLTGWTKPMRSVLCHTKIRMVESLSIHLIGPLDEHRQTQFGGLEDLPKLTTLNVEGHIFNWNDMEPLFALRGLKELKLDPSHSLVDREQWSTSAVRLVAESFPHLEVLVLGDGDTEFLPTLTLPDLDCFSLHSSRLRILSVSVDARAAHIFTGSVSSHPALEEVNLQVSEADTHESEIAELISRLWPNLRNGKTLWENKNDWPTPRWKRIWSKVESAAMNVMEWAAQMYIHLVEGSDNVEFPPESISAWSGRRCLTEHGVLGVNVLDIPVEYQRKLPSEESQRAQIQDLSANGCLRRQTWATFAKKRLTRAL